MLKKYRILSAIVLGTVMFTGIAGCGSKSPNTFTYETEGEETPVSEEIMAIVESVDDSKITLAVGGGGGMGPRGDEEMPEGMTPPEKGEIPEGMTPPEKGEMPEGMTPPEKGEMPEGMTPPENGEMPEGTEMPEEMERPEGRGGRERKKAVLTIEDESVLKVSEKTGSLTDIQEGSMLRITFNDKGIITEISVSEGGKPLEHPQQSTEGK